MSKLILSALTLVIALSGFSQITITQADFGQAGDSIVIGNDNTPPANLSVGNSGASSQSWNFTALSVSNINTLKFEYPANTSSGALFPNADLATERQQDTVFYKVTSTAFSIDGISGDPFNLGAIMALDFNPDIKQIGFPSTLNSAFNATAFFDSTGSCAALGYSGLCDSARIKRKVNLISNIDAYGTVNTPGGTYTTIRQYLKEDDLDTIWIKNPNGFPIGWVQFMTQDTAIHYYRWYANNESWPVLSVTADGTNGNITSAEFKIDDNLISYIITKNNPNCNGDCDGYAKISGLGGVPPYTYQWPANTSGGTNDAAGGLCAGNYYVTVFDANGDSTTQLVEMINPPLFSVAAAIQPVVMGGDGAIDVTATGGTGAITYNWSGPNGFTANTEDLDSLEEGNYSLLLTDARGCDSVFNYLVFATGISEVSQHHFLIYPNPAHDALTLVAGTSLNQYVIRDLLGNIVLFETNLNESKKTIDISRLTTGLYLVEVNTADGTYLKKLTIQ